jgi:two-component system response regulator PrrA
MGSPDGRRIKPGTPLRHPIALIGSAQEWSSRALASLLQAKGYAVLLAHTGAATRDQARTKRPDIILLDTTLTDMDDLDLCRALRDDPLIASRTPIITLSEEPPTEDQRLAALQAGASDVLSPPLHLEEVYRKLDACVSAKRVAVEAPE